MSKTFTASNGLTVSTVIQETRIYERDDNTLEDYDFLGLDDMNALREYFLAERDKGLGRWRDPENPDYVVYSSPGAEAYVVVLNEHVGVTSGHYSRHGVTMMIGYSSKFDEVAYNYFKTHHDPKPWHDAKHLEIWALSIQGCPSEAYIYRESFGRETGFRPVNNENRVRFDATDSKIVEGHRIWPEER